jgi:uncharacterized protein YjbI with pentapeptide repeats
VPTRVELINKLYSLENKHVIAAVAELRMRGWLTDGSLHGIGLCHAQFQGVDLMKADLRDVDFHQADLESADLCMANLQDAKLTRTNLRSANFSHADLAGADLYKADLRGARNLTREQLLRVRRLWGAIMPDGETYDGRYGLPGDLGQARWAKVDLNDPKAMAGFYGVPFETYLRGQGQVIEDSLPGT